ncbi:acyl-CoA dehydrogenase family protein [Ilumatobacter sp.]|uniref:acyl-CoA dehydrogenase family protein n=1 Tax=Ilumatobacter sp. TaxID=1967498 RepID=UPI003AF59D17
MPITPDDPVTDASVADAARAWFDDAWDPDISLLEWRERLVQSGWAVPSWSTDWFGLGLPAWADRVAHRAIREAGGVTTPLGVGASLAAPTLYDHGSDELRRRLLRPTLTGELTWCQLFSEPGAGSDLAGLTTTAVRDGDQWVVNGQKVWNTSADHADMAILVARHDWDSVKHAGLTYFVIDMRQPGIEVRPIRQMNEHSSFNEVFLTDAVVPHENVVGGIGDGWAVARGTLAHERSFAARESGTYPEGRPGRVLAEAEDEAERWRATYVWYPQREGRIDLVVDRARDLGRLDDPVVRQEMMKLISVHRASSWTAARAKAARELGRPPGSEGSIGKLAMSEVARRCNRVHSLIAGARGLLTDGDDALDAVVAEVLVSTPAQSIAGGTDEIQHNIIGENVLGLPKEPAVDRGVAFREVGRREQLDEQPRHGTSAPS